MSHARRSPDEMVDASPESLAERELSGLRVFESIICGLGVEDVRLQPECPAGELPELFYARAGGLTAQVIDFSPVPVNLTEYLNGPAADDPTTLPSGVFEIMHSVTPADDSAAGIVTLALRRYVLAPYRLRPLAGQLGNAYFADREHPYFVVPRLRVLSSMEPTLARCLLDYYRTPVEIAFLPGGKEQRHVLHPEKYGKTPDDWFDAMCVQDDYFGWLAILAAWYKMPTFPDNFLLQDWQADDSGQTGSGAAC